MLLIFIGLLGCYRWCVCFTDPMFSLTCLQVQTRTAPACLEGYGALGCHLGFG